METLEQEIVGNEGLLEEILIVEEDLADEYVAGTLNQEERADFERHFLATPERRQNVRFAQALNRYVTTEANREFAGAVSQSWATHTWVRRAAGVVAIIAVAVAALWFLLPRSQTPKTFAALTLTISSSSREAGAESTRVPFPLNADALKISLRLPSPPPPAVRYRAELLNDNGGSKSLEPATQDSQSVVVVIPGAEISRGRYAINLFAIQADGTAQRISGSYYFTVE
jgi:methionine-rich copper-binding protein CopC